MLDKTANLKANNLMILKNVMIKIHIFLSYILVTYEILYTTDIISHIVYLVKIIVRVHKQIIDIYKYIVIEI